MKGSLSSDDVVQIVYKETSGFDQVPTKSLRTRMRTLATEAGNNTGINVQHYLIVREQQQQQSGWIKRHQHLRIRAAL